MAEKVILIDTSILIDFYRKTDKENSKWIHLIDEGYKFAISAVSKYEIYAGATENQLAFWDEILEAITVIPFDEKSASIAADINSSLKKKRKQIDIADLFIASTAIANNLSIATLNKKHFVRISELNVIE